MASIDPEPFSIVLSYSRVSRKGLKFRLPTPFPLLSLTRFDTVAILSCRIRFCCHPALAPSTCPRIRRQVGSDLNQVTMIRYHHPEDKEHDLAKQFESFRRPDG